MKSRIYKYHALFPQKGRGKIETSKNLRKLIEKFRRRQIQITCLRGDNEFEKCRELLDPTPLEITAANEHLPTIERGIRTLKERCRCSYHSVPYRRIPKLMVRSLGIGNCEWLNAFPVADGISSCYSASAMIDGKGAPDGSKLGPPFGSYAQVYDGTDNSMEPRTVGAVALRPSNSRGGHYFMSLRTGRQIHAFDWTELPVPDFVIEHVEALAEAESQPDMGDEGLVFEWSPGVRIVSDDAGPLADAQTAPVGPLAFPSDDESIVSVDDASLDMSIIPDDDDVFLPNDDDSDAAPCPPPVPAAARSDVVRLITDMSPLDSQERANPPIESQERETDAQGIKQQPTESDSDLSYDSTDDEDSDGSSDDSTTTPPSPHPSGRPRRSVQATQRRRYEPSLRGKRYSDAAQYLQARENALKSNPRLVYNQMVHYMFTQFGEEEPTHTPQMSAKAGIKLFGERAVAAMIKEYNQLHEKKVTARTPYEDLTPEQKKRALNAINTIKKKRCGKIKGRTVADGRSQRAYVPREEATSPTVSHEGLIATTVIAAHERRATAVFDIPGAYLNADMPKEKFILLKFESEFVDIMCEVNPEYLQDVRQERGKKVLYVRVVKAIYGCIESALLWYQMYVTTLKRIGFKVNPIDKCIANLMKDGAQCTIAWYVDDNLVSHRDEKVLDWVIKEVEKDYGEVTVSRGKKHVFLGMDIEFCDDGTAKISTKEYLREAIEDFGEDVSQPVPSPALNNLRTVRERAKKLDEERGERFHSITAKLLWVMKRSRPDLEPAISFLSTRVAEPDMDDWDKLRRVIRFINCTIDDERIIGADNLHTLLMWVDAAHAVHGDMRGHRGGVMSMGLGVVHARSAKQKLNTKSTTESELVGLSKYLPYDIHFKMLMEHQGYTIKKNTGYQDNEAAIKMEKNGRNSCTGNSRHIDIRYFFVKDRVDKGELEIKYCNTKRMLADFFTKPLQGLQFRLLRDIVMGYRHVNDLKNMVFSPEERVENNTSENSQPNEEKAKANAEKEQTE